MTIPTISPVDVAALQSQGKPVDIIDVRTPAEFAAYIAHEPARRKVVVARANIKPD